MPTGVPCTMMPLGGRGITHVFGNTPAFHGNSAVGAQIAHQSWPAVPGSAPERSCFPRRRARGTQTPRPAQRRRSPRTTRVSLRARRPPPSKARNVPRPSVTVPARRPFTFVMVFTHPTRTAMASTSSRCGITATLCGMVTLNPRRPGRARMPCRHPVTSSTRNATYT